MNRKDIALLAFLLFLLVASFIIASSIGASKIGFLNSIYYLTHPGLTGTQRDIIWQIRLPRVVLGIIIGAGLACCGAVFQGLFRNPLAEPYTLGISGGAALGTTLGIVFGLSGFYLPFSAFLGSCFSILLVYTTASRKQFSNPTLILSGVILSFLFSSSVLLIFAVSKARDVHGVILWLMGDLSSLERSLIGYVAFFVIFGIGVLYIFFRDLNILTLGEERALHLGVDSTKVKKILFVTASFITGACVAVSGIIGFVGLIVPHFARRLAGVDHKVLLPVSCLVGAIFLILCDAIARVIIRPMELPVGVITGIFGGIFFLGFLVKTRDWRFF